MPPAVVVAVSAAAVGAAVTGVISGAVTKSTTKKQISSQNTIAAAQLSAQQKAAADALVVTSKAQASGAAQTDQSLILQSQSSIFQTLAGILAGRQVTSPEAAIAPMVVTTPAASSDTGGFVSKINNWINSFLQRGA